MVKKLTLIGDVVVIIRTNARRGFTLLLGFLVILVIVFSALFSQTNEIVQVLRFQKKIFTQNKVMLRSNSVNSWPEKTDIEE